jgi:hypothetical protein
MVTHTISSPRRTSLCPNAGCGVTLPHDELQAHRDGPCLFEEVACPYTTFVGCKYRCIRRDMAAHSADVPAHFAGVMGVVAKVQQLETTVQQHQMKVQGLEKTVEQQQTGLRQQQTKVHGMEKTVEQKQSELQILRAEYKKLEQAVRFVHRNATYAWEMTEVEQLETTVQQLDTKMLQLKTTHQQQQTKVQVLETTVQQQQAELQVLRTENSQLKHVVGSVRRTYTWEVAGCSVPSRMYSPIFNVGGFEFEFDMWSDQPQDLKDSTGFFAGVV